MAIYHPRSYATNETMAKCIKWQDYQLMQVWLTTQTSKPSGREDQHDPWHATVDPPSVASPSSRRSHARAHTCGSRSRMDKNSLPALV